MNTYPVEWKGVKAVIFDVDGTLYSQRVLRIFVLKDIMLQCLFQPWRFRDVLMLKKYRDIREKMKGCACDDIGMHLYNETAKSLRMRAEDVRERIEHWMLKRPLRYMKKCRYRGIDRFCRFLQQKEVRLGVYSDYPAEDKLASLDLPRMEAVCSTDEGLCRLKPDPEGLLTVTRRLGLPKGSCIFIGDRDDTDGESARKAGMPFLLRKSNPRQPHEFSDYDELLKEFRKAMNSHERIP